MSSISPIYRQKLATPVFLWRLTVRDITLDTQLIQRFVSVSQQNLKLINMNIISPLTIFPCTKTQEHF